MNIKVKIKIFTLIEVLVAVAIMVLLFVAAGSTLVSVQRTWIKVQNKNNALKTLISVDKIVNSSFPNIVPFEWKDEDLHKRSTFLGDHDRISFATLHRINVIKDGGIRFITIFREGDKLIVGYRDTPQLYWDELPMNEEVIAEGVQDLTFIYADVDRERQLIWEDDWDEEERKNIPMAVQMTIQWEDGSETSWLRRTAGSGIRSNFGRRFYDRATK
jgi:type II secretory pathway component PulJ